MFFKILFSTSTIQINKKDFYDKLRYGDVWGDWHGGSGGAIHSFEINPGSVIDIVQGKKLLAFYPALFCKCYLV